MSDRRDERKRRRGGFNIGWIIFLLFAFGGPIFRWLQSLWVSLAPGGAVGGPSISGDFIPWIIGGVVATVIVVSVLRAITGTASNSSPGPAAPPYTPLPRADSQPPASGTSSLPPSAQPTLGGRPPLPGPSPFPPTTGPFQPPSAQNLPPRQIGGPPRFEPIIDPRILVAGIVGAVILGGAWLLMFAPGLLSGGAGAR